MSHPLASRTVLLVATLAVAVRSQNIPGNSNPNGFLPCIVSPFSLFAANNQSIGMELWRVNFPSGNCSLVKDIRPAAMGSNLGSNPRGFTKWQNVFVFSADDGATGTELWRTDGTSGGTFRLADINTTSSPNGPNGSGPHDFTVLPSGLLLFFADDGVHGDELWQFDGTSATPVKDIHMGSASSAPHDMVALGNRVLFSADDGICGPELWSSDGTPGGTQIVRDIYTGPFGSVPGKLMVLGTQVLFAANTASEGRELWRSDGTAAGTNMVVDIEMGAADSAPGPIYAAQQFAFFTARNSANGRELWMSNGTANGTSMVADIRLGQMGSEPSDITSNLFDLWFVADDGVHGREIWQSTVGGGTPSRVTDIIAGQGSVTPRNLVPSWQTRRLVFADDSHHLWQLDGGSATTLATFKKGPSQLTRNNNWGDFFGNSSVVFVADDGAFGTELWRTDGITTSMFADIAPNAGATDFPEQLVHVDSANDDLVVRMENGTPFGLAVFAFGQLPVFPGLNVFGLNAPINISLPPLLTLATVLDGAGAGSAVLHAPDTPVCLDFQFVSQAFNVSGILTSTELCSLGMVTPCGSNLFGGSKAFGALCDNDHRYEIYVRLPSGTHPTGRFVLRHLLKTGEESQSKMEASSWDYNGTDTNLFFKSDEGTDLLGIQGVELWFVQPSGETLVWKSYC